MSAILNSFEYHIYIRDRNHDTTSLHTTTVLDRGVDIVHLASAPQVLSTRHRLACTAHRPSLNTELQPRKVDVSDKGSTSSGIHCIAHKDKIHPLRVPILFPPSTPAHQYLEELTGSRTMSSAGTLVAEHSGLKDGDTVLRPIMQPPSRSRRLAITLVPRNHQRSVY
jgi:hypothetical protein